MTQTHKIEEFVKRYCDKTEWNSNVNKNQHRERLRRTLNESEMMRFGVERLVDDAVSAKEQSFYAPIEKAVRDMLGIDESETGAAHENHNHTNDVIDMDIDEQEEGVDRGEQDMELSDADDAGAIEPHAIQSRIEAFVRSFREAPSSQELKADPDVALLLPPPLSSIPIPPVSATSSQSGSPSELEAPMYSPIRPDDEAFIKFEPLDPHPMPSLNFAPTTAVPTVSPVVHIKQENVSPKEEPAQPVPLVPALPAPPKLTLIKRESIETFEKKQQRAQVPLPAVKEKRDRNRKKSLSTVKKEPVTVVDVPELEEILSDVSSVHTSDLSDYDDRISLSSGGEEAENAKRKISLQEVRKLEDQVKKGNNHNSEKQSAQQQSSKTTTTTTTTSEKTTRRERKANPKYTSDEYF